MRVLRVILHHLNPSQAFQIMCVYNVEDGTEKLIISKYIYL